MQRNSWRRRSNCKRREISNFRYVLFWHYFYYTTQVWPVICRHFTQRFLEFRFFVEIEKVKLLEIFI